MTVAKKLKPRKKDHRTTIEITVRDGNTPIYRAERDVSELAQIVEEIKRKL